MIRIDLAHDEFDKGTDTGASGLLGGLKLAKGPLSNIHVGVKTILVIGMATAVAVLPALFIRQYENYLTLQHLEKMQTLKEKIEVLYQENSKLKPFQMELQSYEKQRKVVTDRLGIVRDLLEARTTPINVLDAIGQSLPARTWINSVDFNLGTDPLVIIMGQSYSNEEISDFVDKLSESIHFVEVNLDEVLPLRIEDKVEVKAFTISARPKVKASALALSAPAKPAVVKPAAVAPEAEGLEKPADKAGKN